MSQKKEVSHCGIRFRKNDKMTQKQSIVEIIVENFERKGENKWHKNGNIILLLKVSFVWQYEGMCVLCVCEGIYAIITKILSTSPHSFHYKISK